MNGKHATPRRPGRAAAILLLAALVLGTHVRPVAAQDEWFGPDKVLHFIGGFLVTSVTYTIARNALDWEHEDARLAGFTAGIAASIAKEVYDGLSWRGTASGKDLVWDGLGIGFGMVLLNNVDLGRCGSTAAGPEGLRLYVRLQRGLPSLSGFRPPPAERALFPFHAVDATRPSSRWGVVIPFRATGVGSVPGVPNPIDSLDRPVSLTNLRGNPPGD